MMASPSTTRPLASTARQRSASPSCASPRSAPWDTTADCSASMCVDPQPSLMFSPLGSALIAMTFAPAARYARGAAAGRGAVRAVDDDGQFVEPGGERLAGVAQVAVERVLGVDDPADARAGRAAPRTLVDELFDAVLGGVVELVPARRRRS